jgi:hypothetical protein
MRRRQHRHRQVIDTEVPEILKRVCGGRHPGPAESGDDYDVGNVSLFDRRGIFLFMGHQGRTVYYEEETLVIFRLSFLICHFGLVVRRQTTNDKRKMTNGKCLRFN